MLIGWVASVAITAAASSSTCAIATASRRSSSNPTSTPTAHALAGELRSECCIGVAGRVISRGEQRERQAADRRDRGRGDAGCTSSRAPRRRRSRSATTSTPARRCASSIATSTCAARRCRRTSSCARSSIARRATTSTSNGFSRARDAVHGEVHARRRAQLPRAVAPQPRQLLRARRVAADLQAALHGRGLRSLLPDRALLPRRGPAPRPAARVHADRRRDVVRARGRRLSHRWKG